MKSYSVAKNYKPKWTFWKKETIQKEVARHKRYTRRAFKRFLKTGNFKDFERSQRVLDQWDFD